MTPEQVGQPLLNVVNPEQPTPQQLLAEIGKRSMESIRAQRADVDATRSRIDELKDKGKPLNLTPFALAVDMMTGSNTAKQAAALHQQQSQPLRERERLEQLLRRQQGALTDDEINMLKTQYKQAAGGDMSFADKEALRQKNKLDYLNQQFSLSKQLKQMGLDAKAKSDKAKADAKASKPKEFKRDQSNAAAFGRRIEQAEKVFGALKKKGYDRGTVGQGLQSYFMPGAFQSSDLKQQEQAERNFINAALRRESGAAIAPHEFESAELQYFPRAGDSPEVLAQKEANRKQTLESLKVGAGEAWEAVPLIDPTTPAVQEYDWDNMSLEEIEAIGR